jgi:hypothetical protein
MTTMAVVGRPRTTRGVSGPDDDRDLDRDRELVRSSHLVLASSQRASLASRGERISYLMFVIDFAMKHSRNRRPSQRTFPWRRFSLTRLPDSLASEPRWCGATQPNSIQNTRRVEVGRMAHSNSFLTILTTWDLMSLLRPSIRSYDKNPARRPTSDPAKIDCSIPSPVMPFPLLTSASELPQQLVIGTIRPGSQGSRT